MRVTKLHAVTHRHTSTVFRWKNGGLNESYCATVVIFLKTLIIEIDVVSTRLFFFGYVCFEGLMKMFYIWIPMRRFFFDIFEFFTRYSLRYLFR